MIEDKVLCFDASNIKDIDSLTSLKHDLCYFMDPNAGRFGYDIMISGANILQSISEADKQKIYKINNINNCMIYALQIVGKRNIYISTNILPEQNKNIELLLDGILFSAVSCRYNIGIDMSDDNKENEKIIELVKKYKENYPELNFYFKMPLTNKLVKTLYRDRTFFDDVCQNKHIKPLFILQNNELKREEPPSFVNFLRNNDKTLEKNMFFDPIRSMYVNNKDKIRKLEQARACTYSDSFVYICDDIKNILKN